MSLESMYAPAWRTLKKDKKLSLVAPRILHPRIIKAIIKRKNEDIVYKLELSPDVETLYSSSQGTVLTFILRLKKFTPPINLKEL